MTNTYEEEDFGGLMLVLGGLSELYTVREAWVWLGAKQRMLDDQRPIDLIAEGEWEKPMRLIEQILEGVYI
jgi:hypothetical protein